MQQNKEEKIEQQNKQNVEILNYDKNLIKKQFVKFILEEEKLVEKSNNNFNNISDFVSFFKLPYYNDFLNENNIENNVLNNNSEEKYHENFSTSGYFTKKIDFEVIEENNKNNNIINENNEDNFLLKNEINLKKMKIKIIESIEVFKICLEFFLKIKKIDVAIKIIKYRPLAVKWQLILNIFFEHFFIENFIKDNNTEQNNEIKKILFLFFEAYSISYN
jgi:hypothetical protein